MIVPAPATIPLWYSLCGVLNALDIWTRIAARNMEYAWIGQRLSGGLQPAFPYDGRIPIRLAASEKGATVRTKALGGVIRKYRSLVDGRPATLAAGMFIMAVSIGGTVWGCTRVTDEKYDKDKMAIALSLTGGLYLLLTGVWVMTRNRFNERRVWGLVIMLAGILGGTGLGLHHVIQSENGEFGNGEVIFILGLLVHLVGVLWVKKE